MRLRAWFGAPCDAEAGKPMTALGTRGFDAAEKRVLEQRLHAAGLSWRASKTATSIVSAMLDERASSASMPAKSV